MTGRVLSEQMITQLEQSVDNEMVQDLIATIRDREEQAKANADLWQESLREVTEQNTILREALDFYADSHTWIGLSSSDSGRKAREALAKVRGDE